jgi:hypothetical protein
MDERNSGGRPWIGAALAGRGALSQGQSPVAELISRVHASPLPAAPEPNARDLFGPEAFPGETRAGWQQRGPVAELPRAQPVAPRVPRSATGGHPIRPFAGSAALLSKLVARQALGLKLAAGQTG